MIQLMNPYKSFFLDMANHQFSKYNQKFKKSDRFILIKMILNLLEKLNFKKSSNFIFKRIKLFKSFWEIYFKIIPHKALINI